jgi:uncharacterized membrane protein YkoI
MRRYGVVIGVVLGILLAFGSVVLKAEQADYTGSIKVKDQNEATFSEMAKISLDSAVNEALKQVPGKVMKAELENENGYLVYGVEIAKADHQIYDVKVDAGNGKVLKIDQDKKEVREGEDFDNGHEETGER